MIVENFLSPDNGAKVPVSLNHAIIQAESFQLDDVTKFSYEMHIQPLIPTAPHDLALLSHVPLSGTDALNRTERYSVDFAPDRLIMARIEGARPMSQVQLSLSQKGAAFSQWDPLSVSEDVQTFECKWSKEATQDIKIRLDGLSLANTDRLQFSLDGATVSGEVIPVLRYPLTFTLAANAQPLETHINTFLNMALGDITACDAGIEVGYTYALTSPDSTTPVVTTLPILETPRLSLDPASRSTSVKAIAQEIQKWYQAAQPSTTEASFDFSLKLYRPQGTAPILDLTKVRLWRTAVSDL